MQYLAAFACLIGAFLQIAVWRAPEIIDLRRSVRAARRITIVALLIAAYYLFSAEASNVTALVLGMLGMGQMLYAVHNLDLDKFLPEPHLGPDR